jgi:tellurite resistance protein TerC
MRWLRKTLDFIGLRDWPVARKIVVAVIGTTIVLIGIAMVVLPGPGTVVILSGLVILASEFAWARWLLRRGKKIVKKTKSKAEEAMESLGKS